jgi:hypothetical protein
MTMTADTPSSLPARPVRQVWLRIGLIILSGLIFLGALSDFPAIFIDHEHKTSLLIFAQRVTNLKLVLAPLIAGAALLFAIRDKATHAIVALATLMLVNWMADLPSIAIHGMELTGNSSYLLVIAAQRVLYPLLGIAAMALALRNERLVTAAVLTAIPTAVNWLSVVIFAVGVILYGF